MFDNDEEKEKLVHFGVLGMKWGRRKGESSSGTATSVNATWRKNSEDALRKTRSIYGMSSGKNLKKMTDQEIDDEIAAISLTKPTAKVAKRLEQENAKLAKQQEREAKDQKQADKMREWAKADIDSQIELERSSKNFDERKRRSELEKVYEEDLNATVETVRKQRRETGQALATAALIIIGSSVARYAITKAAEATLQKHYADLLNGKF